MYSKRSVFNCILIFTLIAGLGACRPPATTTIPPSTATPRRPTFTPEPTNTSLPAAPPDCRQNVLAPTEVIHAVHMGGNWGTNFEPENTTLPAEYFEYLRDLNVNWVGISVALHYDDSMDSTVERKYSGVQIPTFTDEFLRKLIRTFHQYGICVYMTLAFEAHGAEEAEHPVLRIQLGEPTPIYSDGSIQSEFWPWAIDHQDHERFVAEFWQTYTQQAVHFGKLAGEEGVGLYSLGTETEGLFRTRPGDDWPNDFREELHAMVAAVREVYSGPLTYDMWTIVFTEPQLGFGPGSKHLWEDLGFDVIGLSAYFPMADCPPMTPFPVEKLEQRWERIFQEYLIPLQAANPGRPIVFTEFGYTDSPVAAFHNSADAFTQRVTADRDGNGLDDGEEMQANIYQALFNVMDRYAGVVNGIFTWEMWIASNEQWASELDPVRSSAIRGRLAEDVLRLYYGGKPRNTIPTPIPSSSDARPQLSGETCEIYDDQFAVDWWNTWTWKSDVNTNSSKVVHWGEHAIEVTLQPGGKLGLSVYSKIDVSPFRWLVFYVSSREAASQQIDISVGYRGQEVAPPLDIVNYIEGGQIEPWQWHQVVIPVDEINPGGGNIDSISFINGSNTSTFFIDDIFFVEEAPVPTAPVFLPTPAPTPNLAQWGAGHIVYDDLLASGWSIDPWGGQADIGSTEVVYSGSQSIEVSLEPGVGITFDTGSAPDISNYAFLVFHLNGGETADQQLYVEMKSSDNVPLGEKAYLTDYIEGYPLQPGRWHVVTIPLSVINPEGVPFAWFDIGDASGNGAATFYVDDIRLVGAKP